MSTVKFIAEVFSSTFDTNGNRYHFARLMSTETGKVLYINDLGGPGNVPSVLHRVMGRDYDACYPTVVTIEHEPMPKAVFRRRAHAVGGVYEHEVTREMIEDLDRPHVPLQS